MSESRYKKYVKSSEKAIYILKKILEHAPISMAELTDLMMKDMNMKFTTARTSVSQIVGGLLGLKIFEYVGTGKRGTKIIDLTPKGFILLLELTLMTKEAIGITFEDLINYFKRKGYTKYVPLLILYKKIHDISSEEELEEEELEFDILDYFEFYEDIVGSEDIPYTWREVEEYFIDEITDIIDKYFFETPSRIVDLFELMKNLNDEERIYLKKALYSLKSKKEEELERTKRIIKELENILTKT